MDIRNKSKIEDMMSEQICRTSVLKRMSAYFVGAAGEDDFNTIEMCDILWLFSNELKQLHDELVKIERIIMDNSI